MFFRIQTAVLKLKQQNIEWFCSPVNFFLSFSLPVFHCRNFDPWQASGMSCLFPASLCVLVIWKMRKLIPPNQSFWNCGGKEAPDHRFICWYKNLASVPRQTAQADEPKTFWKSKAWKWVPWFWVKCRPPFNWFWLWAVLGWLVTDEGRRYGSEPPTCWFWGCCTGRFML